MRFRSCECNRSFQVELPKEHGKRQPPMVNGVDEATTLNGASLSGVRVPGKTVTGT